MDHRYCRIIAHTGLLLCAASALWAQPAANKDIPVLVKFKKKPGKAEETLLQSEGGKVKKSFTLVDGMAAELSEKAIEKLKKHGDIEQIEVDGTFTAHDAELDATWGVKAIGSGTVHDAGNLGTAVKVCVLDTGIDTNHPDLYQNYRGGKDFVNGDSIPEDDNGHGTHTAGTIAATMNSLGVRGVAPRAELYIYKVLGANGSGNFSTVISALQECVAVGGKVTNNSYGSSVDPGSMVKQAFDNAAAAGVTHVASAGNSGSGANTVGWPAQYASVMAVAATDGSNLRASFSSTGPDVEIAAPGVSITSTYLNDGYAGLSGTSMAGPHVAGVAALVVSCGITSPTQVRQRIRSTALPVGSVPNNEYGYGVVRADQAALNCGAPAAPVTDLGVSSVSAPGTVNTNTAVSVNVLINNVGNQAASGFSVTLRDNGVFVASKTVPSLSEGASTTLVYSWSSNTLGSHTLTASVDQADGSAGNNSGSTVSQVQAPPPAPPISLSATASKVKGNRTTVLRWSGALGSQVTIYRSGSPSATMTQINDGAYTDSFGKGSGTFTYKVCETASPTTCSATVSVAF